MVLPTVLCASLLMWRGWETLNKHSMEEKQWTSPGFSRARAPAPHLFRVSLVQLGIEICATAFGGEIEDGPEGIDVGCAARVLAGIGCFGAHLAAPEEADCSVAACEDIQSRDVRVFGAHVGASVVACRIRI